MQGFVLGDGIKNGSTRSVGKRKPPDLVSRAIPGLALVRRMLLWHVVGLWREVGIHDSPGLDFKSELLFD